MKLSGNPSRKKQNIKRQINHELLHGRGFEMMEFLKEDLHQLQRTWKIKHRFLASMSVMHYTMFRKETSWPGYYYCGDHMKLDDQNWHCFTLSRYDRASDSWDMEKAPVYHIIN